MLLVTLMLQRSIGLAEPEIVQWVKIGFEMNEVEQVIADKIHVESGIRETVIEQSSEQLEEIYLQGYGAPFVFSDMVDDQKVHFILENDPHLFLDYTQFKKADDGENHPQKQATKNQNRSFADFYLNEITWRFLIPEFFNHQKKGALQFKESNSFPPTGPPPRLC
jgi:hypothetical protein